MSEFADGRGLPGEAPLARDKAAPPEARARVRGLRALVIAPQPFYSPRGTPLSVYYRTLITAEQGVEVDLLTYGEGQDVAIDGVRIVRIPRFAWLGEVKVGPSLLKIFLDGFVVVWTLALLLRRRYDFVHAHEEAVFFCWLLKPVFGFRLVYDMHSSLPQQLSNFGFTKSRFLIGAFDRLERASLRAADAVITICPDLADYATGLIEDKAKHFLIENSILEDVKLAEEAAGRRDGPAAAVELPEGRPIVAYAGTLEPYQGIDLLLRAFALVRQSCPEAYLVVAGGNPGQVETYSALARELGIANDCRFTGRLAQREARGLCARATAQVSPRIRGTNTPLKVYEQLASGVPLVAFLSGGVDSSLMAAAMGPATTFSIGFDDPSYNELDWARRVAGHLGLDHHDRIVRPSTIDLFQKLMWHLDDPIGDFSIFPTYLVSRLAREHVTVALGGDGGDELFGGYETYLAQSWARYYGMIPAALRRPSIEAPLAALRPRAAKKGLVNKAKRFVEGFNHPAELGHARWRLFHVNGGDRTLLTPEASSALEKPVESHIVELFRRAGPRQPVNRCLYVDLKSYLCDNILTKVDRMSMACSLEARVPYLDRELVELAFRMPDRQKLGANTTKVLLKRVAARHVPAACVYRPKEGFSIPIKNWLGTEFRPLLEDLLDPSRLRQEGLFVPGTVERFKTEHFSGAANHSHVLWGLMVFQAWRDLWLK